MPRRSLIAAMAVWMAGCGSGRLETGPVQRDHQVVALDTSTVTHVSLKMAGGELRLNGGATGLLDADFSYSVPSWKPVVVHTTAGEEASLDVSQGSEMNVSGRTENTWQLALNDAMPMDITAHLVAGEAHATLGSLNLKGLQLYMTAGNLDVDLRGTPRQSYSVEIHGGVGSATVHVPTTVAISAVASGGIGDIKVTGLELRDGHWINPRMESSPVRIDLNVQGSVGEIRIVTD